MKTQSPQRRYKSTMKRRGIHIPRVTHYSLPNVPIGGGSSFGFESAIMAGLALSMMRRGRSRA